MLRPTAQPALSKSIASLEKSLGIRLFDRYGNRIRLNEAGRRFYEYAEKSLELLQKGQIAAINSRYLTSGTIHIDCFTFSSILEQCVLDYTALNPDVRITINQGLDSNISESCDLLLYAGLSSGDFFQWENTWVSKPLMEDHYGILISPRYREYSAETTALSMEDVRDAPFVTIPNSSVFFSDITYKLCLAAGFSPKVLYETNDFLIKTELVGQGRAIALMPDCCLEPIHKMYPDIRSFRIKNVDTSRTIFLARKQDTLVSEVAMDFWEFTLDHFAHDRKA